MFDGMDQRTVVSWNSMIIGYVQSGEPEMAIAGGRDRDKLSNVILVEALHAYADLGDRKREKFVDKLNLGCDAAVTRYGVRDSTISRKWIKAFDGSLQCHGRPSRSSW
ncbi:Pentatricopeptide repeat-containing protein, chloroplastic, partial [Cucurbita argyrosperma subsp. sororia]